MKTIKDIHNVIDLLHSKDSSLCLNASAIKAILDTPKQTGKLKKKSVPFTSIVQTLGLNYSAGNFVLNSAVNQLRLLHDSFKYLCRHVDRNWEELCTLLEKEFVFQIQIVEDISITPPQPSSITIISDNFSTPTKLVQPPPPISTTPVKTRRDCVNCISVKKLNFSLRKSKNLDRTKIRELVGANANFKKIHDLKTKNQKLKRYEERVKLLKQKVRNLEIKNSYYIRKHVNVSEKLLEVNRCCDRISAENKKLGEKNKGLLDNIDHLRLELKKKDCEISGLHRVVENIETKLEDVEREKSKDIKEYKSRDGKAYSVNVRRCVYYGLLCNVPVRHCGQLIAVFLRILNSQKLMNVPSQSTCAQMAHELGVLSTIRLMEFINRHQNLCLSWDATTIDGSHVNEIHITADKVQCLVLSISHLPGGKTVDYVAHITSALFEAAATFSRYSRKPQSEVLASLKSSISCTLTDRAAVNACVTRQLCEEMDSQLIQLNCNVHPLDGVARSVKTNLARLDLKYNIKGCCFGKEGTATNLINAVSVLRFKDGTGDPTGFKNFLRENDLPVGTFVRYVGNRIHVVFHLAGLLILHREKLQSFIEKQCTSAALLRSSILRDLTNDKIMSQVWAMAVLGKVFSGPWMTQFYSSEKSNLEMVPLVQTCVQQLKSWVLDSSCLQQLSTDAFGNHLSPNHDSVLSALDQYDDGDDLIKQEALAAALTGSLSVLERQLSPFLENGELAEPSEETTYLTASAPTHNMASERALGCLDKMWRCAPNATLGFLNGKVQFKMNNVMEWLEMKEEKEMAGLINFAIGEAKDQRAKDFLNHQNLNVEISKRRKEVSLQRQNVKKRAVLKQIKSVLKSKIIDSNLLVSESVRSKLHLFLTDSFSFIGTLVMHSVDNIEWYGRIHNLIESKGVSRFELGYWSLSEPESSSIDSVVSVETFFADVAIGNVVFL